MVAAAQDELGVFVGKSPNDRAECFTNLLLDDAPKWANGGCACSIEYMLVGRACELPSSASVFAAYLLAATLVIILLANAVRGHLLYRARRVKVLGAYDARSITLKWAMLANFVFAPATAVMWIVLYSQVGRADNVVVSLEFPKNNWAGCNPMLFPVSSSN